MSYSIKLRASGGNVQVETVSGTVPDGSFVVSGHEDDASANLAVVRYGVTGPQVASSGAMVSKTMPVVTS